MSKKKYKNTKWLLRKDALLGELSEWTSKYRLIGIALANLKRSDFANSKEYDAAFFQLVSQQNILSTKIHATQMKIENVLNKNPEYGFEIVDVSVRRYLP